MSKSIKGMSIFHLIILDDEKHPSSDVE